MNTHELLQEHLQGLSYFMVDRDRAIDILETSRTAGLDADTQGENQECKYCSYGTKEATH